MYDEYHVLFLLDWSRYYNMFYKKLMFDGLHDRPRQDLRIRDD